MQWMRRGGRRARGGAQRKWAVRVESHRLCEYVYFENKHTFMKLGSVLASFTHASSPVPLAPVRFTKRLFVFLSRILISLSRWRARALFYFTGHGSRENQRNKQASTPKSNSYQAGRYAGVVGAHESNYYQAGRCVSTSCCCYEPPAKRCAGGSLARAGAVAARGYPATS